MSTKYAILVGDGMADFPMAELGGKTPLQHARTPAMDEIVSRGHIGLAATVPQELPPGSDVANMSLMGYDPTVYYSGRAPIEAASMGITLRDGEVAFRCNLVTLSNDVMRDYSAGHIETEDAHQLILELKAKVGDDTFRFYPGISYRHLLVAKGIGKGLDCTPPHDISDKEFASFLPKGVDEAIIRSLMERARAVLSESDVTKRRVASGKRPATDIWLWGQGPAVTLPTLQERYGLTGSVISAVDLVRGLGKLAGLKVRIVEGATGYLGTNYAGKVEAAKRALAKEDFVYLHVEAPDETSHEGSLEKKIQAIEEFDKYIVGEMLALADERSDLRILVLPDHETPVSLKTHSGGPVPYGMCGPGISKDESRVYSEAEASAKSPLSGPQLFEAFIRGTI